MDLAMAAPLAARVGTEDDAHDAQVVWLDTGRAHALLARRLPIGSTLPLTLAHDIDTTGLQVRVLAVRVRPEIKSGPRVLHLCSLVIPPEGPGALEALLRAVNPTVAPPPAAEPAPVPEPAAQDDGESQPDWDFDDEPEPADPAWDFDDQPAPEPEPALPPEPGEPAWDLEVDSSSVSDSEPEPEPERPSPPTRRRERLREADTGTEPSPRHRRSNRRPAPPPPRSNPRRLPPQRRLSNHIPRATPGAPRDEPPPTRPSRPQREDPSKKGLRTAELVRAEFHHGNPPMVIVAFTSTDLWRRSTRSGEGWFQLTLADLEEVPEQQDMSLEMTLPTGVNVQARVQVARRGRGRMILEARSLSESTQEALRRIG